MCNIGERGIRLRTTEFGTGVFRVVASILPSNAEELTIQLAEAFSSGADAVELRTRNCADLAGFAKAVKELDEFDKQDKALILNIDETGSDLMHAEADLCQLTLEVMEKGLTDAVDIPCCFEKEAANEISAAARTAGVCLIRSARVYAGIASEQAAVEKVKEMSKEHADMIRLEYLANDDLDLIKGARAARRLKEEKLINMPFCISLLGDVGLMYRVLAERCGNDFGYAVLKSGAEDMLLETVEQNGILREIFKREAM